MIASDNALFAWLKQSHVITANDFQEQQEMVLRESENDVFFRSM